MQIGKVLLSSCHSCVLGSEASGKGAVGVAMLSLAVFQNSDCEAM